LKNVTLVYPGTFDPPTNGHLDLIYRSVEIFDEIIVAVLRNKEKQPLFTIEERMEMLRDATANCPNIRVDWFEGLLVDYMQKVNGNAVLRGIRAVSDYEFEMQMVWANRKLYPGLETVFMMSSESYAFLSSRLVRQIASFGGSVKDVVPPDGEERLRAKFAAKAK
jgi:pantetheine-phosphate adenylyltransferase